MQGNGTTHPKIDAELSIYLYMISTPSGRNLVRPKWELEEYKCFNGYTLLLSLFSLVKY